MSGIDGWGTNKNIWNCLDINCKQKGTLGMAWVYSSRSVELVTTNYVSSTNNVTVSTYVLHLLTVRPYLVYLLSKPGTRYGTRYRYYLYCHKIPAVQHLGLPFFSTTSKCGTEGKPVAKRVLFMSWLLNVTVTHKLVGQLSGVHVTFNIASVFYLPRSLVKESTSPTPATRGYSRFQYLCEGFGKTPALP